MDSSAVSKDNSGSVFGGFLLSILFIDELIVCLPAQFFFPFSYCFFTHFKNKFLFPLFLHEPHPSVSQYDIATKLNTVIDPINSLVNVGLFQTTPMICHIAVVKLKLIGTDFIVAAAFFMSLMHH